MMKLNMLSYENAFMKDRNQIDVGYSLDNEVTVGSRWSIRYRLISVISHKNELRCSFDCLGRSAVILDSVFVQLNYLGE